MISENKKQKYLLIVLLLISVTGITLGFAAYQRTLTIQSSATVNPSVGDFNLQISSSETEVVANSVTPVKMDETSTAVIINATDATLSNSGGVMTISDINVEWNAEFSPEILNYPYAKYTFYIHNTGESKAYLTEIDIGDIVCTAKAGTTQSTVDKACDNMEIILSSDKFYSSGLLPTDKLDPIEPGSVWKIDLMLAFGFDRVYNGEMADGPFDVNYGDTILVFSSQEPEELVIN